MATSARAAAPVPSGSTWTVPVTTCTTYGRLALPIRTSTMPLIRATPGTGASGRSTSVSADTGGAEFAGDGLGVVVHVLRLRQAREVELVRRGPLRDVEQHGGVDRTAHGWDDDGPRCDVPERAEDAVGVRHPVGLVRHHEGRRPVAGVAEALRLGRPREPGGVDDLHESAPPGAGRRAEPDEARECGGIGCAARFDQDDVEHESCVGQVFERVVESTGVLEAADTPAGDRGRLVDLPDHQSGVDVHGAEVVHHDADAGARRAEQGVDQARLADAERSGDRDDGHGGARVHG